MVQFNFTALTAPPPIWGGEGGINFSTKNKEMGGKRMANKCLGGLGWERKGGERVKNREGLLEKKSAMHSCDSPMYFYGMDTHTYERLEKKSGVQFEDVTQCNARL